MRYKTGFTLIEVLVSLAIIGILVTIAYPSYEHYLIKSRRTESQVALLNVANRLERYYLQENTYAGATLTALGVNTLTDSGYYQLTLSNLSDHSYTATALPQGSQTKDQACASLSLNQLGEKLSTGTAPTSECWH